MGGGGGQAPISRSNSDWLQSVRNVNRDKYEADTNELLQDVSAEVGTKDDRAIHDHLEVLKEKLRNDLSEAVEIRFGGSLKKHTYVDGVSDVDALVTLSREEMGDISPREALTRIRDLIQERLPDTHLEVGRMAVTVKYSDGLELQLLPAIRRGDRVQVPSGDTEWSPLAAPDKFASELARMNASRSFLVVPVIKLFKAIQDAKLPESVRLSGYHVESLAMEAFGPYDGPLERKAMLEYFVDFASSRVLRPSVDSTGQSRHVDERMGPQGSQTRKTSAAYLARLHNRMEAANRARDKDAWLSLFGSD